MRRVGDGCLATARPAQPFGGARRSMALARQYFVQFRWLALSVMGQKQPKSPTRKMSAMPPITDEISEKTGISVGLSALGCKPVVIDHVR